NHKNPIDYEADFVFTLELAEKKLSKVLGTRKSRSICRKGLARFYIGAAVRRLENGDTEVARIYLKKSILEPRLMIQSFFLLFLSRISSSGKIYFSLRKIYKQYLS